MARPSEQTLGLGLAGVGEAAGDQVPKDDLTALLGRCRTGSPADQERLFGAVQAELRRIAGAYMRRERPDHTLQPTALVNEAYLRLFNDRDVAFENRGHFYGVAARVMRQVLVDYARKRRAQKRGVGGRSYRSASKIAGPSPNQDYDVLALHEALTALAAFDPRQAEIVELRYFGGLTEQEVARVMRLAPVTIRREIASARFWLGRWMQGDQ